MGSISTRSGPTVAADFVIAICISLGLAAARFLLDSFVYKRLAYRLLRRGADSLLIDESRLSKFSESMWKLTYYGCLQLWFLSIMQQEPWSIIKMEYFEGWPNQDLRSSMKFFYMCQCGFYIYSIAALLTWETRRKDFSIMMSHHIITTMLIGYSYLTSFFRIGTVILALHDTTDVFLESAKVLKYSEKEMGASACFGLFAGSWFLLRLVLFPFFIIRASSYHALKVMDYFPEHMYYAFNAMLLTLLVFHMYWWKLICAMIMRQLTNRGHVGEDIRSDSED